jgi:hypothetical protein
MTWKSLTKAAFILCFFAWNGCASEPTLLERNWGKAHETAKFNQTLNPNANKNLSPVEDLDGKGAENSIETYRKSFEVDREPAVYDINLPGIIKK